MKHINLFIIALATCLLQSCGLEESSSYMPGTKRVEFVARSTSYDKHHVSTKADADISAIEDNIYSAYFILFDNNGNKIDDPVDLTSSISSDKKTIDNKSITITPDDNTLSKARGCYLINVPKSYAESITKIDDLKTVDLDIEYAETSVSGMVGVPVLKNDTYPDGVMCLPMFGISSANPNFSKEDNDNATFIMEIPLKRVFAKVQINYPTVNISGSSDAEFTAKNIIVNNIPKKVRLLNEDSNQTNWAVLTNDNKEHYLGENNLISYGSSNGPVTFYVPEHILKLNETNDDQSRKPSLLEVNPNHKAIYVSLSGTLTKSSTDIYDVKYKIYLGENPTNNFDLIRNKYYINYISITGTSENDARVEIYKQEEFISLINNNESANCYIITSANKNYILPAYKGAFADITTVKDSDICSGIAAIVWEDSKINTEEEQVNVIELIDADQVDNRIKFKVSGTIAPGNALVAIKHPTTKEILWSWHLWFCTSVPTVNTYDDKSELMDRNLGAKDPEELNLEWLNLDNYPLFYTDGLFYQFGRKDPLRSITEKNDKENWGGDLNGTNANPHIFDLRWANQSAWTKTDGSKGTYDPCPAGYKVAKSSVWTKSSEDFEYLNTTDYAFIYNDASSILSELGNLQTYPYGGYLNSGGNLVKLDFKGNEQVKDYTSNNLYLPINYTNLSSSNILVSVLDMKPRIYKIIKYNIGDISLFGNIYATGENNCIKYGFEENRFALTYVEYQEGTWIKTGRFPNRKYTADFSNAKWQTVTINLETGETDMGDNTIANYYLWYYLNYGTEPSINLSTIRNILSSFTSQFTQKRFFDKENLSSPQANMVRCVRIGTGPATTN